MTVVTAGALTVIGVGYHAGTAPVVLGLFLTGFGLAAWNVAVNVRALVERHAGRAIKASAGSHSPRTHCASGGVYARRCQRVDPN